MHDNRNDYIFHYYLRNIVHNLKHMQDERLIPYDITPQQARIVGSISDIKDNGNSVCQKDIEMIMELKGSSITSLLQGLERKGFILRSTGISDGRAKELSLTPKGQALIDEFNEVFNETENKIVQGMTEEQKELFLQMLKIVSKNVEK
jgi:MarR family transcriptional regulator, repressor for mepA